MSTRPIRPQRSPRRGAGPLAAAVLVGAGAGLLPLSLAHAAVPFGSEAIAAGSAIALAQPLASGGWNLVVIEQRQPAPPCWRHNSDGTVTTYETYQPETVCGRYLSNSAYSLRIASTDLRHPWRLRVEEQGGQLQLLASGNPQAPPLLVGSGQAVNPSSGSGLVALQLHEGWSLERRTYQGRSLGHLYVANAEPLPVLQARAAGTEGLLAAMPAPPPPPAELSRASARSSNSAGSRTLLTSRSSGGDREAAPTASSSRLARLENLRFGGPRQNSSAGTNTDGIIALEVVPYRGR